MERESHRYKPMMPDLSAIAELYGHPPKFSCAFIKRIALGPGNDLRMSLHLSEPADSSKEKQSWDSNLHVEAQLRWTDLSHCVLSGADDSIEDMRFGEYGRDLSTQISFSNSGISGSVTSGGMLVEELNIASKPALDEHGFDNYLFSISFVTGREELDVNASCSRSSGIAVNDLNEGKLIDLSRLHELYGQVPSFHDSVIESVICGPGATLTLQLHLDEEPALSHRKGSSRERLEVIAWIRFEGVKEFSLFGYRDDIYLLEFIERGDHVVGIVEHPGLLENGSIVASSLVVERAEVTPPTSSDRCRYYPIEYNRK